MPELPEVEVTKLGIAPHIEGKVLQRIAVHEPRMRWPVPADVHIAEGCIIESVTRRAKYLFLNTQKGAVMLHLGMSGNMRVVDQQSERKKHDHIEFYLDSGKKLVLNDPRRFGCCLWQAPNVEPLMQVSNLGPEPLTDDFDGVRLHTLSRGKQSTVKTFIMDNAVVVGVGNIYANEALFLSGIDPRRAAGKVSKKRYLVLADNIKKVLATAITQGGTTLKDFSQADGKPGYFAQQLLVYGRSGKPCLVCETPIRSKVIGQRNTFFCISCQR